MVISALRSLTQESGYQLEVSSFGVCAKKLVRINNPMAALRMAWLAETSVANERTDRVELPDGDTVLCAGLRPEGDGRHWGITFRLHAYDRKKQLRRPTGWVHFSNWSHARKSDLKAILIYARIIDSVHRSPR